MGECLYFRQADPGLRIRVWNDEAVLFSPMTGDTHLLPLPSLTVLEGLDGGRILSRHDMQLLLADSLGSTLSEAVDVQVEVFLDQLIQEFMAKGLIEPAGD